MKSRTLRTCAAGIAIASLGMGLATVPTAQAATTLTSKEQLKSVSVPSMCDNPAGTLKDGELPGYYVSLDYAKSKLGQIKPGGGKEAAAVFHCSQGGIGWANHIVFYSSDLKVIGHTDLASVGVTAGRQLVQSVSISAKGTVTANVIAAPLKGDNELWGSAGAKLTFKWNSGKKKVTRTATKVYDDTTGIAKKILSLTKAGKVSQAKKYATTSIAKSLAADWKYMAKKNKTAKRKGKITIGGCGGTFSTYKGTNFYKDNVPYGYRGCMVIYTWPMPKGAVEQYSSWWVMTLNHKNADKNWTSWYARKLIGVAG